MKKLLLLLLLINISFIGFSQYKGNPAKARSLLDKSALKSNESEIRELLINAKGEIDAAILLDKQKQKPNTWLIRGDVYAAIAKGYSDIDSEPIERVRNQVISILGSNSKDPNKISSKVFFTKII